MSPQRRTLVLMAIGGVLLLTNPLWLFPHEGDVEYTYNRSGIVVQNGTFVYDWASLRGSFAEENSLNTIACQHTDHDDNSRACALDHHLVNHSAITVQGEIWNRDTSFHQAEFVHVNGTYYQRIRQENGTQENRTVTYDVERVTPQMVLATSARNISRPVDESSPLELRIASTGDTVTSFEELDETQLGNVYRLDGTYYTVVKTDMRAIDHGLDFLRYEVARYFMASLGVVLAAGALIILSGLSSAD